MSDTTRRRLHNFEGRAAMPVHGTGAIAVGLLFAGVGAIPLLIGVAMMTFGEATTHPPGWVVAAAGTIFVVFGLGAATSGVRGLLRRRRARQAFFSGARSPWDWDHPWDRVGARDDIWKRALRRFVWIVFLAIFLAPFHYVVLTVDDTTFRVVGGIFLVVFDVAVLFGLVNAARATVQGIKYGSVFLQYEQFPMLLGRRAAVRLMLGRPVDAGTVTCRLRFVEETVEVSHQGRGRTSHQYVFDQLYEETIAAPLAVGPDGRQTARIEIALPEGDYETRLSADEPRYWLLEASASTPGVDLHARFLLPVYAPR